MILTVLKILEVLKIFKISKIFNMLKISKILKIFGIWILTICEISNTFKIVKISKILKDLQDRQDLEDLPYLENSQDLEHLLDTDLTTLPCSPPFARIVAYLFSYPHRLAWMKFCLVAFCKACGTCACSLDVCYWYLHGQQREPTLENILSLFAVITLSSVVIESLGVPIAF